MVLATRNAHKVAELQRILSASGLDVELLGLDAFPDAPEVEETESSFAGNALLKARAIAQATGLPALADDSGICVDALNGMPGIYSARWSGRHGDDRANLDLLLGQTSHVPDGRRGAQFICAAAYVEPESADAPSREHVVEGVLEGSLARAPRGSFGFGYDPIFIPLGLALTTAELRPEEKDAISHRGRAFRALAQVVASR